MNTNSTVSMLNHRTVLIRLSAGAFIGNPQDKSLISEVEGNHNLTETKRISVRKKIMQGKEISLCSSTLQNVRLAFEHVSAPWLDGGFRIVKASNLIAAKIKINDAIREFETAVDSFVNARDVIIDRDRVALNGTFKITDYPTASELRAKFYAKLEVSQLPPADFRVEGLADEVCAQLQIEMEQNTLSRVIEAKRDLITRIQDRVSSLVNKLENMPSDNASRKEKIRFHASTIENISEACKEVRNANFDDDQTVENLATKIESAVANLSPELIREDENARKEAKEIATKAMEEITLAMAGFCL